ncbi:MAG: hypothetical protein ACM36C_02000 [Acidobacteriota bacterium]
MSQAIAYFWSARAALGSSWRPDAERTVAAMPGIVLEVTDGESPRIVLADGVHVPVELIFARRRGGGTVRLVSGPRLILASLTVAVRLQLSLSDVGGEAFDPDRPLTWLPRIAFAESAREIERMAEEVGLLPRRVRLMEIGRPVPSRQRSVFFV